MSFISLFKKGQLPQLPKQTEPKEKTEMEKNIELFESKQLKFIPEDKKLQESDFKKIFKNLINKDIFGDTCAEWCGVYCNKNKEKKGIYINYYFNRKKASLHRLLYKNYVNANLNDRVYLIHKCNNKLCCNINHLQEKREKENIQKEDLYKIDFQVSF